MKMKIKNTIIACLSVCLCISLYFNARLDVYNSRKKEQATLVKEEPKEEPKNKISAADEYELNKIIANLEYATEAAYNGSEKYQNAFTKLGLSWLSMARLTTEERFIAILQTIVRFDECKKKVPNAMSIVIGPSGERTLRRIYGNMMRTCK